MKNLTHFSEFSVTPAVGKCTTWSCPSNIALVKYWGKKSGGVQIPANPSISWSLSDLKSTTSVSILSTGDFGFEFWLDGKPKPSFEPKLTEFFQRIMGYCPWLKSVRLKIESTNNFPHGTGIASSAAGLGALSTCLVDLETSSGQELNWTKVSFLSRLGSGSACRSMFSKPAIWGESSAIEGSSDMFAVEMPSTIHSNFTNWEDCVLIVDAGEKSVSSTQGHSLLNNHPYANARFEMASRNLTSLVSVLEAGDVESFIKIVESEALQLHAMMQTSVPYYLLMRPNTLAIIESIWKFRESTDLPMCFTLDAGANVHLLFNCEKKLDIMNFVNEQLLPYCESGRYLCSSIGGAPERIANE